MGVCVCVYANGKKSCAREMELPFSQFSTKLYNFSWQALLITEGYAHVVGSDSTLMMSFSMTSQHSGGQTTVHTVISVCDHLAHWHIPDTDASLMPLHVGWLGMLVGFLAKLLAWIRQVLAVWRAGLVVVSTVCPFRPTRARLATNRGTSRAKPSNGCILVAFAHPAVHHDPIIWMIQTKLRFIWEQYSFPFSQTPPQMGTWPS